MQKKLNLAPEPETINSAAVESAAAGQAQQPDLLRARIYGFSEEKKESARVALLAMILESVAPMSASRLQTTAQFINIAENDRGPIAPVESFFDDLLIIHYNTGLTPELAADKLDEFRTNFAEAMDIARRLNATYPELVSQKPFEP